MKRIFIYIAAAAALAACSKAEVIPVSNDAETEITYLTAPIVKSESSPTFSRLWQFKSTAFYLQKAKSWAANAAESQKYIDGAVIEWDTDVWRNKSKKYYWPKDGELTFFAWTNVTETIKYANDANYGKGESAFVSYIDGVTVDNTNGVKIASYDVTTDAHKNVDILVADVKADQVANNGGAGNGTPVYNTNGVPTLFKHKLCKVKFTAQTVDASGAAYDYSNPDNITFTINSIVFKGIDSKNTYTQGVAGATNAWGTTPEGTADQTYFDKEKETSTTRYNEGFPVTSVQTGIYASANQYYYMPQAFEIKSGTGNASDVFVVNYTIKYDNGTTETIDQECILNNGTSTATFDKWEMAHIYTINLKFSLNEILWDPAVEDWTDVNKDVNII